MKGLKEIFPYLLVFFMVLIGYIIGREEQKKDNACTPSQEHQQLLERLDSLELQVSEQCGNLSNVLFNE